MEKIQAKTALPPNNGVQKFTSYLLCDYCIFEENYETKFEIWHELINQ